MRDPLFTHPITLGLCPCGQKIWAEEDPPSVVHELPACKAYRDLDALEFLAYVQRVREGAPHA